jgi:hypothetical protein
MMTGPEIGLLLVGVVVLVLEAVAVALGRALPLNIATVVGAQRRNIGWTYVFACCRRRAGDSEGVVVGARHGRAVRGHRRAVNVVRMRGGRRGVLRGVHKAGLRAAMARTRPRRGGAAVVGRVVVVVRRDVVGLLLKLSVALGGRSAAGRPPRGRRPLGAHVFGGARKLLGRSCVAPAARGRRSRRWNRRRQCSPVSSGFEERLRRPVHSRLRT